MLIRSFATYLFICLGLYSYTQNTNIKFQHISNKQGLSNSNIECIMQDSKGFLWFGTQDGLNRYNGYEFKQYKFSYNDSTSLPDNFVWCLAEDDAGDIWVGTNEKGLAKYSYTYDNFKIYSYIEGDSTTVPSRYISCLYKEYKGTIWVGTNQGLAKYNKESDDFTHVNIATNTNENVAVSAITELHDSVLVIGSYNYGLSYLDNKTQKFKQFTFKANNKIEPINLQIRRLYVDKNVIWFSTQTNLGLYKYNILTQKLKKYTANTPSSIASSYISSIFKDSKNNLWVGGSNEGTSLYIPKNDSFINIKHDKSNEYGISSNTVTCMFEDNANTVWFGTHFGGISYFNHNTQSFKHYSHIPNNKSSLSNDIVGSIVEDENGEIWIGTNNGINLFNKNENTFTFFSPNKKKQTVCNHLCPNNKGSIYTGAWKEGFKQFSTNKLQFSNLSEIGDGLNQLQNKNIKDVEVDSKGLIWLASHGDNGIHIYDPVKQEYYHHKKPGDFNTDLFKIKYAADIFEDSKKRIWVVSYAGLFLYNDSVVHFTPIVDNKNSISSYYCFTIFEDAEHNIWLGNSKGIDRIVETNNGFQVLRYSEMYEIPSHIVGILQDKKGYMWLSSFKGIIKFDPKSKEQTIYDIYNGLQGNKFKEKAALLSKTGEMYFGGYNGFNVFNPDSIKKNELPPRVYITDLQILNKLQKPGKSSTINKSIIETNYIELTHEHSVFNIHYVALNYLGTEKNNYAYMLEGFDNNWRYVGSERKATYTNLDAGIYTFKVIASNNDGVWNNEGAQLTLKILPPWWKTIVFRLIFMLVLIAFVYGYIKIRFDRIKLQKKTLEKTVKQRTKELRNLNKKLRKNQNQLEDANSLLKEQQEEILQHNEALAKNKDQLEELVAERTEQLVSAKEKAEESDRLKSAFLANMSHEIRTPMNAIVGFSHMLTSDFAKPDDKEKYVGMIKRSCDSLLILIDDILEISLIEANQIRFINEWVDVDRMLDELMKYYSLNNEKEINIKLIAEPNYNLKLYTDITRFKHIFTNLLDNAFKFTAKGQIQFGYEIFNAEPRFFVRDTGIGIDKDDFENIFEHFYKIEADTHKLYRGTGIGLSICKSLINFMNGEIWLDSELGKGTCFYFTIPGQPKNSDKTKKNEKTPVKLDLKDKTVIIAEDEPINFELVKDIITPTKAEILWARNGQQAVEIIERTPDHNSVLVLMDIKMPIMNGMEAANNIGKINMNIPIIALTAYAHDSEKKNILKQNFVDYISKPITPSGLLAVIAKYTR